MTDRIHSLTVVLEHDMREDDAEVLMSAIRCLRNVAKVTPIVSDQVSHMAQVRAKQALADKIMDLLL